MRRAAPLLILVAVLAGCGGGGEQASPLDRGRKQADAACDRAERAVRQGGRPETIEDLERVMVRVGDVVIEATDEIRALKVPEGERGRVEPVIEQLQAVRKRVKAVRGAIDGGNVILIGNEADSLRIDGSAYAREAERAGLKRCGRRAVTEALADELETPLFTASAAVSQARFDEQVKRLRRFLAAAPSPGARAKLWDQMGEVLDSYEYDVTSMPRRLDEVEDRFGFVTMDLEEAMDAAAFHLRSGSPAAAAKARRKEQAAFRGFARLRAQTRALLKASGPAGAEALERLDAEGRGKGSGSNA